MPFRCAHGTFTGNQEPSLDEMLAEPAIRLAMAKDGIEERHFRQLAGEIRERLRQHGRTALLRLPATATPTNDGQ